MALLYEYTLAVQDTLCERGPHEHTVNYQARHAKPNMTSASLPSLYPYPTFSINTLTHCTPYTKSEHASDALGYSCKSKNVP